MGRDLSIEHPEFVVFATIRTLFSSLWLVNNPELDERILAYLARYQEHYGVIIYAFIIMGNHYHLIASFPRGNKAAFFRDLNGMISKLTKSKVKAFEGGKLWARRVRTQVLPNDGDILERFFYAALNPVAAGLVEKLSQYPSYNSFSDATRDRKRTFEVVEWQDYNNRKRKNPSLTIAECTKYHRLVYTRLPGHEHMGKSEYVDYMNRELEKRRGKIVNERRKNDLGFLPPEVLRAQIPGERPRSTKTSSRDTHRPLVLTLCAQTRKTFLNWYFSIVEAFRIASKRFRDGEHSVEFPPGTYRPWSRCGFQAA